jgi:protein phosphatase
MKGMGTTLVGAMIEEDHLAVVNVGDSRLYRIRGDSIKQITKDHTLIKEEDESGILSEEEVRKHPRRHILTSALGTHEKPKIALYTASISSGDLFLICSDGLYTMLANEEILAVIKSVKDKSLYKMGLSLVLKANLAGGPDDITVILLSFYDEQL